MIIDESWTKLSTQRSDIPKSLPYLILKRQNVCVCVYVSVKKNWGGLAVLIKFYAEREFLCNFNVDF